MIRINRLLPAAALLALAVPASAQVELVAFESFDYVFPNTIFDQSGGTGWMTNWWAGPDPTNDGLVIQANAPNNPANPFPYPGADGVGNYLQQAIEFEGAFRLPDAAAHPDITAPDVNDPTRLLFGVDDTTMWFSFSTQAFLSFGDHYGGFSLFQQFGGEQLFMGSPWASYAWGLDPLGADPPAETLIPGTNDADAVRIVTRVDYMAGDERVRMWIDPAVPHPLGPADLDVMMPDLKWNEIRCSSGGGLFYWDNLVIEKGVPVAPPAITLFDINADPSAWSNALKGKCLSNSWDFDDDADYGIIGGDGPVSSAGNGFISAGLLPDKLTIDSQLDGPGGPSRGAGGSGLVGIGPSAGFGNGGNMVAANFFTDAFGMTFAEPKCAIDMQPLTLLGGSTVDIIVEDEAGGVTLFAGVDITTFPNVGISTGGGPGIVGITIFDTGGGAEGIQGAAATYVDGDLGTIVCSPANANSTGEAGRIAATGDIVNPTLCVSGLPAGENGYFLASDGFGSGFIPPGSEGLICLDVGVNLGRYDGNIQVVNGAGAASMAIDPTAVPWAGGPGAGNPPTIDVTGLTWYFQFWYRDGATSNFTDSICIDFFLP